MIRAVTLDDAADLAAIYNHYVENTVITFEETPVTVADMRGRIERTTADYPWFVADIVGAVTGYAYAARWHARCAYRDAVETSVYVDAGHVGRGVGKALYEHLIEELRKREFRCAIGAVALPNAASVALHESLGFERVGRFKEVGFKFGRRIDVGYWQLML